MCWWECVDVHCTGFSWPLPMRKLIPSCSSQLVWLPYRPTGSLFQRWAWWPCSSCKWSFSVLAQGTPTEMLPLVAFHFSHRQLSLLRWGSLERRESSILNWWERRNIRSSINNFQGYVGSWNGWNWVLLWLDGVLAMVRTGYTHLDTYLQELWKQRKLITCLG